MNICKLIIILNMIVYSISISAAEEGSWWETDYYQNMKIEYLTFDAFLKNKGYESSSLRGIKNYGYDFPAASIIGEIETTVRELLNLKAEVDKDNEEINSMELDFYSAYLSAAWNLKLVNYLRARYTSTKEKLKVCKTNLAECLKKLEPEAPPPAYENNASSSN